MVDSRDLIESFVKSKLLDVRNKGEAQRKLDCILRDSDLAHHRQK